MNLFLVVSAANKSSFLKKYSSLTVGMLFTEFASSNG